MFKLNLIFRGGFGRVYKCIEKATQKEFAVKIIRTQNMNDKQISDIMNEAEICNLLRHPNIVRLHYTLYDNTRFYFIFDLITGGELFDDIVTRMYYTEKSAKESMQNILDAISYCHSMNVIHHDLKPENLLLESHQPNAKLKLADFGLSIRVSDNEARNYKGGCTYAYAAPEILRAEAYNKAVDIWSCGVILYILLSGYPPFHHNNTHRLKKMVIDGKYSFEGKEWRQISLDAKDLISQMMTYDFRNRITADNALQHRWLKKDHTEIHLAETQAQMKKFNILRKWKIAALATIGTHRLANSKDQQLIEDESSLARPASNPDLLSDNAGGGHGNRLDVPRHHMKRRPDSADLKLPPGDARDRRHSARASRSGDVTIITVGGQLGWKDEPQYYPTEHHVSSSHTATFERVIPINTKPYKSEHHGPNKIYTDVVKMEPSSPLDASRWQSPQLLGFDEITQEPLRSPSPSCRRLETPPLVVTNVNHKLPSDQNAVLSVYRGLESDED